MARRLSSCCAVSSTTPTAASSLLSTLTLGLQGDAMCVATCVATGAIGRGGGLVTGSGRGGMAGAGA